MNNLKPRLDAICKNPDNALCADCGARGPRWSSVKLGILICAQCAGIHRKLGTHVSFVQSVTIDKWKPEWVETVEKIGNRIANQYFEANVPDHMKKPAPSDTVNTGGDIMDSAQAAKLEKWIRNKYELKVFVRDNMEDPRDIVKEGKDPRHVEPYGVASTPVKVKKSSPRKKPVESPVLQKPALLLPTGFEWRDNVFIVSWARAHGIVD